MAGVHPRTLQPRRRPPRPLRLAPLDAGHGRAETLHELAATKALYQVWIHRQKSVGKS